MKNEYIIYYCKWRKKTKDPIVVERKGNRSFHNSFLRDYGNVQFNMTFNNARGKAKKSGATTVMKVKLNDKFVLVPKSLIRKWRTSKLHSIDALNQIIQDIQKLSR